MNGLIIKGIGGFYYVKTTDNVYQAKGRGIFKKNGITLTVGDLVDIEILEDGDAVINQVFPRKNIFIRPPIANIDTFVIVVSATKPKPNFPLIDKFLIMSELNNIDPIICINKTDLVKPEVIEEFKDIYSKIYPVIEICAKTGKGVETLLNHMHGKKIAFAGPSGVGKSTLTNLVIPEANMETGDISKKTSRGKHTTRHVEIFQTKNGGMVFDTPGFTSFDILEADEDNLMDFYPELYRYKGKCRFDNCRHIKEPDCAVRDAVSNGDISQIRYDSYLRNMEDIKSKKKY